jgi:hypothetical protein
MNITKSLKLKKKLIKQADAAYNRFSKYNSVDVTAETPYDAMAAYQEWIDLVNQLIDLKTKIHLANAPVYGKIFRMSELKSLISLLKRVSTTAGKVRGYGEEVVMIAAMTLVQRDELINQFETEIDQLQDELEAHNALTKI